MTFPSHRILVVVLAGILSGSIGTAAHAQSSVTLYGVLDGALLYTSKTLSYQTGADAGKQFSMTDAAAKQALPYGCRQAGRNSVDTGTTLVLHACFPRGVGCSQSRWLGLSETSGLRGDCQASTGVKACPNMCTLFYI
ncbi:hypothetical protein [Paraburkholderia sp. CNPSo 3281]|uniref:hypothetical protein n=1 Tax=Paraburkholderia sp. CNPSo 3281 TaxID=2940933 RepID=UPI0035CCFCDC